MPRRSSMLRRASLGSLRTVVVGFALLLVACANPPTAQQPSATAASSSNLSTMPVALATTVPPMSLPSAIVPTLATTTVPTAAPDTAPPLPSPSVQPANLPAAAVVRVIDGDTVDVRLGGQVVRLRLIGIDTPEVV